jgi:hypothetical protein
MTMEAKETSRDEALLPEVLPHLIALLNDAPDFGQCGIDIVFHEGIISRIVTRTEKSYKDACGDKK